MASIKHLLHISASKQKVFGAISTIDGLAKWWTVQTTGSSELGGTVYFRFDAVGCDMKITSAIPDESIEWECVAGFPDWIGTKIKFLLDDNDGKTRVRFEHYGWNEENDFFAGCSFSWGWYLESLRQLCQTGLGESYGSESYKKRNS